jgi:alpha-ribazole phosphatase
MEIALIRHTTPDVEKGICYGQSDILLQHTFMDEYQQVLQSTPRCAEIIYTSPLSRCVKLANLLSQALDVPVCKDDRLKELNFGEWEMKRWDDIGHHALMKWMNDYENESCPQGESYKDLKKRVTDFLDEIKSGRYQSIVAVTHGGVIKTSLSILKNVPIKKAIATSVAYGSVNMFCC